MLAWVHRLLVLKECRAPQHQFCQWSCDCCPSILKKLKDVQEKVSRSILDVFSFDFDGSRCQTKTQCLDAMCEFPTINESNHRVITGGSNDPMICNLRPELCGRPFQVSSPPAELAELEPAARPELTPRKRMGKRRRCNRSWIRSTPSSNSWNVDCNYDEYMYIV